jgi:hypothetical protein
MGAKRLKKIKKAGKKAGKKPAFSKLDHKRAVLTPAR